MDTTDTNKDVVGIVSMDSNVFGGLFYLFVMRCQYSPYVTDNFETSQSESSFSDDYSAGAGLYEDEDQGSVEVRFGTAKAEYTNIAKTSMEKDVESPDEDNSSFEENRSLGANFRVRERSVSTLKKTC